MAVDPRTAGQDDLRDAIVEGQHEPSCGRSLAEDRLLGMGTTLTAALGMATGWSWATWGTPEPTCSTTGNSRQVTDDHSWVGEMMRRGELTPAEAAVHPHRSVITRALGTEGDVEPDILEVPLVAGDRLMLCSDGLSGMVLDPQIQELLKAAADPQQAADSLVGAALEGRRR